MLRQGGDTLVWPQGEHVGGHRKHADHRDALLRQPGEEAVDVGLLSMRHFLGGAEPGRTLPDERCAIVIEEAPPVDVHRARGRRHSVEMNRREFVSAGAHDDAAAKGLAAFGRDGEFSTPFLELRATSTWNDSLPSRAVDAWNVSPLSIFKVPCAPATGAPPDRTVRFSR